MSEEQLKAFIAKLKDDQSIQEKLNAAKTADDIVGIAKEHGHSIDALTLTSMLSPEDLEVMTGGGFTNGDFCGGVASALGCNTGLNKCGAPIIIKDGG